MEALRKNDATSTTDEAPASGEARDLLEMVATPPAHLALPSGRVVEARAEGPGLERVTIRGAGGEVELEVRLTPEGPLLRFRSASVELEAARDVRVECDKFHVRARTGIVEETRGNLVQRVGGDQSVKVKGKQVTEASDVRLEARDGTVSIEANDDVEVAGERVRLNC